MPPVAEPALAGMSLGDALRNMPNPPPDDVPREQNAAAAPVVTDDKSGMPVIQEPEIKDLVPDKEETDDEAPTDLNSAFKQQPDTAKREAEVAAEAKRVADEAAAAAEKAKGQSDAEKKAAADAKAASEQRDSDLKFEATNHRPSTRKVITSMQEKARAARDERDRIAAEAATLKRERDELIAKSKTAALPKETEDELNTLRERVRELDITKDPTIEAKYDKRIEANQKSIVDVLKAQGYGATVGPDGKLIDNPKAIADLVRSGLTVNNLYPLVKKLEEANLFEEAETIRSALNQNRQLAQEKQQTIETWKGDYSKRTQAREQQTRQQLEQRQQEFTQQTDTQYRAAIDTLSKDFSYLKEPPAPLATDTPAVRQAKEAAITEYQNAAKAIETEVKSLNPEGVAPEKQPEVIGRINANAILSIAMKHQLIPRIKREMAAKDARIKELETEIGTIRGAGRISRLQGAAPNETRNEPQHATLEDAFKAFAPGSQG